ncbi:MAG: ribonuclease PH [Opitutales bacterium]|nr:ribonuclease PH [Opitutales bacterium]
MSSPRSDGRQADQLRPITFEAGIAPHATGSVLVSFGATRVICAAMIEPKVPAWMRQQGVKGGWLTAEYSMLPYSTLERKPRDISKGKLDGRTVEIQRLIGRSLRAVLDLQKLGDNTLWIDCDVLQADGGTRTASITGAYLAARLAVQQLLDTKKLAENPLVDAVAAVSVFVEVQSSGEESTFSPEQLQGLLTLAQKGLKDLAALQTAFLTRQLLAR